MPTRLVDKNGNEALWSSTGTLAVTAASTVADGANVVEGTTTGAAVVTDANGTHQQYLRGLVKLIVAKINVKVADGDSVTVGTTTDAAVSTDATGTAIGFLRGMVKLWALGTSIVTAKTTVTTAGTRVQLASNACRSVTLKGLSTNTGLIYVGDVTVASTNGYQLSAKETISLAITNTNLLYIDSSVSGEGITFLAVP